MASQNFSESEQMYLVTLAQLAAEGQPVPLSALAQALGIQPVSVNQMVRKLADGGLLVYEPYHGVRLTPQGAAQAWRVLRARRLWAVFLAKHLGYPPQEADALACALEHDTPAELADRLDAFLGNPARDPLGQPIPAGNSAPPQAGQPLTTFGAGATLRVSALPPEGESRTFLLAHGLTPGAQIRLLAVHSSGDVLLQRGEHTLTLAAPLSTAVLAIPQPEVS
ncbi:MAG: hypothetical protein Fur0018_07390 [Anaerolineales bacterium]